MRFLASILVWIVIVGGLWAYTGYRDAGLPDRPAEAKSAAAAKGDYTLEITPTFSGEKDPFALAPEDEGDGNMAELRLNGQALELPEAGLIRGRALRIEGVKGLSEGLNEVYIGASPPVLESELSNGIRLQVFHGGNVIAEKTVWGDRGTKVAGTLSFRIERDRHHEH